MLGRVVSGADVRCRQVESVLSPAVVGALVQLLPKRDLRTEQAARGLGSALVSRVLAADSGAELQLAVIRRLVCPPGSLNLDHMTGQSATHPDRPCGGQTRPQTHIAPAATLLDSLLP